MLLCPWDCPGRRARVACHLLLQGILSTQVLSLHLLPWQLDSSPPSREGSPVYSYVAALSLLLCPRPVTKLCASLCDPIDCSRPGFPFLHCLPEFAQMHVHWLDDAISPSHLHPGPDIWWRIKTKLLLLNIHRGEKSSPLDRSSLLWERSWKASLNYTKVEWENVPLGYLNFEIKYFVILWDCNSSKPMEYQENRRFD